MVRRCALQAFASLTRHSPPQLKDAFSVEMNRTEDTVELTIALGKRSATRTFPVTDLDTTIQEFCANVLKPMAREMLDSHVAC